MTTNPEAAAIDAIAQAMESLPDDKARHRVLEWVEDAFKMEPLYTKILSDANEELKRLRIILKNHGIDYTTRPRAGEGE